MAGVCPILTAGERAAEGARGSTPKPVECIEKQCEWWVTEGNLPRGECALTMMAAMLWNISMNTMR